MLIYNVSTEVIVKLSLVASIRILTIDLNKAVTSIPNVKTIN